MQRRVELLGMFGTSLRNSQSFQRCKEAIYGVYGALCASRFYFEEDFYCCCLRAGFRLHSDSCCVGATRRRAHWRRRRALQQRGAHRRPTYSCPADFTSKDFAASSFRRSASGLPCFRISAARDFSPPRVPPPCVLCRTVFAGGLGIQFFLVPDLRSFLDLGIQLTPLLVWV